MADFTSSGWVAGSTVTASLESATPGVAPTAVTSAVADARGVAVLSGLTVGAQYVASSGGRTVRLRVPPSVSPVAGAPRLWSLDGADSAKGLRRWYQAAANCLSVQAFVDVVGDSHVFGQGGNDANTGAAGDNVADSTLGWVGQLRQLAQLSEAGGGVQAGEGFIFGQAASEGRTTVANAPAASKPQTAPLRRAARLLNGAAQTISYVIEAAITKLGVIQANQTQAFNAAGTNAADVSAQWSKNAVGQGAVDALTNTGIPREARLTVAAADAIVVSNPATAQTYIGGLATYKATNGIIVNRMGVGGLVIADVLGGQTSGVLDLPAADRNIAVDSCGAWHAPGLTILAFLHNEQQMQAGAGTAAQNNVTAALFGTWAAAIVARLVANGGCVLLLGNHRSAAALGTGDSEAAYIAQLKAIALSTDHVSFADMGEVFGTSAAMQAAGQQFAASPHMKQVGHAIFARAVWRLINPAGQYGYQTLAAAP